MYTGHMRDLRFLNEHNIDLIGIHRATSFDFSLNLEKAARVERQILDLVGRRRIHRDRRQYEYLTAKLKDLCAVGEQVVKNLVVLRTRSIIAERLGSVNTYTLNVGHGAVGTGTGTPVAADTQLGAEVNRVETASADVTDAANGIVILSFFWSRSSFVNSGITEFGNFIDGTASANTGRICSRILFASTIDKTAQKTLTVDSQYTVSG